MARKWQKFTANQRKRISFPRSNYNDSESCSTTSLVDKGHFVVYTTDQKRFVIPLAYLQNVVIRQLLHMSEEEFGLPSDGHITLPCDAVFMNYIISLIRRGVSTDFQNALLVAVKQRKIISFRRSNYNDAESCSTSSSIVNESHFVVYTTDQKRSVVPLTYIQHDISRQLLHMSEEEFGLPSDGLITLPCDALFMNYIISLVERGVATDLQNALLISVPSNRCSSASYLQEQQNLELLVC
ncbi:hypothetical protein RDI58_024807 [Solanum bulbocastanum]|uniref:Auxin-induced SAUR n=1 Tax=Solanum bulbocastanum TaxID=147425 RepID=A0AAN8Y3P0_SOLBU